MSTEPEDGEERPGVGETFKTVTVRELGSGMENPLKEQIGIL